MVKRNTIFAALCAALALVLAMPAAMAQTLSGEARATGQVNVRTGPGTGFAVVDQLQVNQLVTVRQCQSGWCYIEKTGPDGWVSARYLAPLNGGGNIGTQPQPQPQPPVVTPQPGGAFNANAYASVALNVRTGPGTNYPVTGALGPGERVQVGECRNAWCLIRSVNRTGWVSERFLTRLPAGGGGQGQQPGSGSGLSISGPNFSFTIGGGADFVNRPVRPEDRGQVCFYENWNYSGRSLCVRPGDSYSQLGSFDNIFSSILIEGMAEVQICEYPDFSGRCAILNASQPQLTGIANDAISSFRVR